MKSNFVIDISTKESKTMRYTTLGDYYDIIEDPEGYKYLVIEVADTGNLDYNFLIGLHELIESWLAFKNGLKDKEITDFDISHPESEDPGSLKEAPYHKYHMIAMKVERMIAKSLKVNWEKYNRVQEKTIKKM